MHFLSDFILDNSWDSLFILSWAQIVITDILISVYDDINVTPRGKNSEKIFVTFFKEIFLNLRKNLKNLKKKSQKSQNKSLKSQKS